MKNGLALFAATALFLLPIPASADVIGLDARNGFDVNSTLAAGDLYDEMREHLASLGHELVPLTSFEARDLAGLDVLILLQSYDDAKAFTTSERTEIEVFVAGGGGLLLHGEGGTGSDEQAPNLNLLASVFGVTYSTGFPTDGGGRVIGNLVSHPVTTGVASFGVDFQRPLTSIGFPAEDLTGGGGNDDALAVVEDFKGGGNVVLMTDTSCWSDEGEGADYSLSSLDNTRLLTNIVEFLLPRTDAIDLGDPLPGSAGTLNTLTASDVVPGDFVVFAFGLDAGSFPIPGCAETLDILPFDGLLGFADDLTGQVTVGLQVPPSAAGLTVLFQAVQPGQCNPSPVVTATF